MNESQFATLLTYLVILSWTCASSFTLQALQGATNGRSSRPFQNPSLLLASSVSARDERTTLRGLKVAVIGGGPSGLLLAHRLLKAGGTVNLYERRPKPDQLEHRAYALGVGIRGRTAIQSVDLDLWKVVQGRGFASERFILHAGPLSIRLRDEKDGKSSIGAAVEPSLLLFQSDLCRALVDDLETRWSATGRLNLNFDSEINDLDLVKKTVASGSIGLTTKKEAFDLVVGCDGVNSIVRKQIDTLWPEFQTTQELLPGVFKVVQLATMPPLLDPSAVQLLIPKSGGITAFVEPTANGRCCVLFAGRSEDDVLLGSTNSSAILEQLESRYPKLLGADLGSAAEQLAILGKAAQASRVTCNMYHFGNVAALAGDAAHATGGVSGQGVNSALQDSALLADCLVQLYDSQQKEKSLASALLSYSQRAVPEGKALYDLSFGPNPPTMMGKLRFAFKSARDSLFKGRFGIGELPLQTLLTTSLKSFADIRRDRDPFYDAEFPDQAYWNATLEALDSSVPTSVT
jgi:kynurenine 3-monooxygenase